MKIEKLFISLENAQLLKEKEFDVDCFYGYLLIGDGEYVFDPKLMTFDLARV